MLRAAPTNPALVLPGLDHPAGAPRSRAGRAAALAALLAASAALASDDAPVARVLIDRRLQERQVILHAISDQKITYEDAAGLPREERLDQFVAMVPARAVSGAPAPLPALVLTDGQRLAGAPRNGEPPPDTIAWQHPVFGTIPVPLDHVARVALRKPRRGSPAPADADRDVLTLLNGDRIAGFLGSFGPTIRLDVDGRTREVSRLRVAHAALANPPMPAGGLTLWLADGSVVRTAALATTRAGDVHLTPAIAGYPAVGRPPTEAPPDSTASPLRLADLVAAVFDAGAIVPLASIEPAVQRPVGDRRWTEPLAVAETDAAVLGAADVLLPGPMTVEWALPQGARRFACGAELPPDLWSWGDCSVVVSVVPQRGEPAELARERLHAGSPRASFNVEIDTPGARLRITLDPDRYGPIQDRVILRRPILLVDSPGR